MGNNKVVLLLILSVHIVQDITAQPGKRRPPPPPATTNKKPKSTCSLKIQGSPPDINDKSPLLLKHKYSSSSTLDSDRFILPSASTDILLFNSGDEILLVCPGKSAQEFVATCVAGKSFKVDGKTKNFSSIKCPQTPKSSIERSGKCGTKDKLHIGFKLKNSFVKFIEICYDSDALRPIYSKFIINQGIANCQKVGRSCSYFATEPYNDDLPRDFYKCENQKSSFEELMGKNRYIKCDGYDKSYLAKGHLAAFADFVYYAQRRATMYHINAVPQWQKFNNANWKVLENKIRNYASNTKADLTVYAGDFGTLKLSGQSKKNVQLFMGKEKGGTKWVTPVPEQMYRLVCDDNKKKGMVYIGINRVDWDGIKFDDSNFRICKNECHKNDLYSGNVDPEKGYIYCCTLPEFMKNKELAKYFPAQLKSYQPLKK